MTKEENEKCHQAENEILRDDFAGRAMQAMMTIDAHNQNCSDGKMAGWAYDIAEAMIDERTKRLTEQ